jgi:hypothetical protein
MARLHLVDQDAIESEAKIRVLEAEVARFAAENHELRAEVERLAKLCQLLHEQYAMPAVERTFKQARGEGSGPRPGSGESDRTLRRRQADPDWEVAERAKEVFAALRDGTLGELAKKRSVELRENSEFVRLVQRIKALQRGRP